MSLQVWLPLCGNIQNQGLMDITTSALGTVAYNTNGKIGSAFRAGGTSQVTNGVSINNNFLEMLSKKTATVAVWVKPLGNHFHYNGTIFSSGDWNKYRWSFGVSQNNSLVDVFCNGYNNYVTCAVPVNEWTHLVSVYNNRVCTLYKNGEYVTTYTASADFNSDATNSCVGRETYANGYFGFNGLINDFRLYDHCLSQAEIYELAKGKMIHLKLDNGGFGQENLAIGSQGVWVSNLGSADGSRREYQAKSLGQSFPVTSGSKVTISFDVHIEFKTAVAANSRKLLVYNTNNKGPHYGWVYKDLWYSQAVAVGDVIDEHISFVTTVNDKSDSTLLVDWIEFYSVYNTNNWYSISNLHIEVGEVETPWAPNSADTFYTSSQLDTQFDCSGYRHDAMTNAITHSSDTARHVCSSVFNGSSSYVKVNDTTWMADRMPAMTINLWAKSTAAWNANTHFFSCTEGGGFNTESGNSGYLRFPISVYTADTGSSYAYKFDNQEIKLSDLPVGEWVMLTWVYDNFGTRTYINGELHHTYLNNSYGIHFNTGARLFLGCEANAANPSSPWFNGQMSDFRIYATAMGQADIRLLYRTSGFVDDQGNVFAGELREV